MQHRHDEIFNILTNTLACIKTMGKQSQKDAKRKVFAIVGETERLENKKLGEMTAAQIESIQEHLSVVIR